MGDGIFTAANNGKRILRKAANSVMMYLPAVLAFTALYCLFLGYLNLRANHSVTVATVVRFGAEVTRNKQKMVMSEIYAVREYALLARSGAVYGLCQLLVSGYACCLIAGIFRKKSCLRRSLRVFSLSGIVCNLVFALAFCFLGTHKENLGGIVMKAAVRPHYTVWLSVALFGWLYMGARFSGRRKGNT